MGNMDIKWCTAMLHQEIPNKAIVLQPNLTQHNTKHLRVDIALPCKTFKVILWLKVHCLATSSPLLFRSLPLYHYERKSLSFQSKESWCYAFSEGEYWISTQECCFDKTVRTTIIYIGHYR